MDESVEYIFSINTGRSGSEYLKKLFDHVADCCSFHEPDPIGNGPAMRQYAQGSIEPMQNIVQEKLEAIEQARRDCRLYVETNHCFIKGFGWLISERLDEARVGVIILTRDASKVAQSLFRVGASPLTPTGREWITTPDKKNPQAPPPALLSSPKLTYHLACFLKCLIRSVGLIVFRKLQGPQWLVNYELACLEWYVQETTLEAAAFRKRFPDIRYYEVGIDELNSVEQVQKMLDYFGCAAKDSLSEVVGKPTNLKRPSTKIDVAPSSNAAPD